MNAPATLRVAFKGQLGGKGRLARKEGGGFPLDVGFAVPAAGLTVLFGPSGSGKTSVLRCIAGLIRLGDGFCTLGEEVWQAGAHFLPPHRRPIGYVFQEPSLFPHLSVAGNLAYGRRSRRAGAPDACRRAVESGGPGGRRPAAEPRQLDSLARRSPQPRWLADSRVRARALHIDHRGLRVCGAGLSGTGLASVPDRRPHKPGRHAEVGR